MVTKMNILIVEGSGVQSCAAVSVDEWLQDFKGM